MGSIEIKGIEIQLPHEERMEKGRLALSSIPSPAEVYINDIYEGMTPLGKDVLPGSYEVKMIRKNHGIVVHDIYVDPGKIIKRVFSLPSRRSSFFTGFVLPLVAIAVGAMAALVFTK